MARRCSASVRVTQQREGAEALGLQGVRVCEIALGSHRQHRVRKAKPGRQIGAAVTRRRLSPGLHQRRHAELQSLHHVLGKQRRGGWRFEMRPGAGPGTAAAASPSGSTTSPGCVQNCPPPSRALPASSPTICSPRSANAPGRTNTGFTLPNSKCPTRAGVVARRFEGQPGPLGAGERDRRDPRVADELQPVLVVAVVEHADPAVRQAGGGGGGGHQRGKIPAGGRVMRVPLGDDRAAGGDRGGEVPAAQAVEGERKIVRADDQCRAERFEDRPDVAVADRRSTPAAVPVPAARTAAAACRSWPVVRGISPFFSRPSSGQPGLPGGDGGEGGGRPSMRSAYPSRNAASAFGVRLPRRTRRRTPRRGRPGRPRSRSGTSPAAVRRWRDQTRETQRRRRGMTT